MSSASGGTCRLPVDPDLGVGEPGRRSQRRRDRRRQVFIVAALGIGGVLGAVSRYALLLAMPTPNGHFPWGTFVINISGSAMLGLLLVLLLEQFSRGRLARPVIGTGVIGAYTTFSTYMVEAVQLIRTGHVDTAVIYVLSSVLLGLFAVWLGMIGARGLVRVERWLQEETT